MAEFPCTALRRRLFDPPKSIHKFIEKHREFIYIYRYFHILFFAFCMFLTSPGRPPDSCSPRPLRHLKNRRPSGGLPSIPHRPENLMTGNACGSFPRRKEELATEERGEIESSSSAPEKHFPDFIRDILTTCLNGRDDDINVLEIKSPIAVKVGSFPDSCPPLHTISPDMFKHTGHSRHQLECETG